MLHDVFTKGKNELVSGELDKDMIDYLIRERKMLIGNFHTIGYPDKSYRQFGIIEGLADFTGNATILGYITDPGYGYDHVKMFHLLFSDNTYGICIWDINRKTFIEEPDNYDGYNLTAEKVEQKYGFKSPPITA